MSGGISPTSSMKSVPWSASSNRPIFCRMAPVERRALIAEKFALEKGFRHTRRVHHHERPAPQADLMDVPGMISLPTPVSPRISTGASVAPIWRPCDSRRRMMALPCSRISGVSR